MSESVAVAVKPTALKTVPMAPLSLDIAGIENALADVNPRNICVSEEADVEAFQWAEVIIARLLETNPLDPAKHDAAVATFERAGATAVTEGAHKSVMLKQRLGTLQRDTEDGGPIAVALMSLRAQVEELNPEGIDFSNPKQAARKLLGLIPLGNRVKEYFSRFESADAVIGDIVQSIKEGRGVLVRDNITLAQDRDAYWRMAIRIAKVVKLLMAVDQRLVSRLESGEEMSDDMRRFLQEEVLFSCRQRIQDLQQQLLVKLNGTASCDILVKTNKELIRGVDRALNVTVDALQIAVSIALALTNQKLVLHSVEALNATTDTLLLGTSRMLQQQGAGIMRQASQSMLSQDNLRQAFANIFATFDQISRFKQEALPMMAQRILEFNGMADEAAEHVRKMEAGNRFSDTLMELEIPG